MRRPHFPGAAKTEVAGRVSGLERAEQRDPHQHRIVFFLFHGDRTCTAKLQLIRSALFAVIATDQERIKIIDPFPDQTVNI